MMGSYRICGSSLLLGVLIRKPLHVPFFRVQSTYTKNHFVRFYENTTGIQLNENKFTKLMMKHPKLEHLSEEWLTNVRCVLERLGVCAAEACAQPHLLTMHPVTSHNYGQVLRECGFHNLQPVHIIRYHTLVRSRTIAQLKKTGLILNDWCLEDNLVKCFHSWPQIHHIDDKMHEHETTLLKVRLKVLSKYLKWRLDVSSSEFEKLCQRYNVLKHRPMADVQESIDIAQNNINFSPDIIKRHGFLISADPDNTKLILEHVKELAGVEMRQVLRMVPAIIKNNHISILKIRDILEEYRIEQDAQRRCFMVYCMCPDTVRERLATLAEMKEFQVLSSNPRALQMVVHQKKMAERLSRLRAANKQCYSLHNLLSSANQFNDYVSNFGDRTCSRDLASVICSSLRVDPRAPPARTESVARKASPVMARAAHTVAQLRRHPYWRHVPPDIVHANVLMLKERFDDDAIFKHCQLLLYPMCEIQQHLEAILALRSGAAPAQRAEHAHGAQPQHRLLTDEQVLSLVLYTIERGHHFTGDGIWAGADVAKPKVKADGG